MKTLLLIINLLLINSLLATQVDPKELRELVQSADYVIEGEIIGVEMRDENGKAVMDKMVATGPRSTNQLFLKVQIVEGGFYFSRKHQATKIFWIPLCTMWHDTLANRTKESLGKVRVFLLKGDTFEPVYPSGFDRDQSELVEIKAFLKEAE